MRTNTTNELTRDQVREVDRRAIEQLGIPGIVLMENAGRGAAEILRGLFPSVSRAAIVCGPGNNGGDGFVISRHLTNAGWAVEVFLACDPSRFRGDAAVNYRIVANMGLALRCFETIEEVDASRHRLGEVDCVIDALLGTGFSGEVRPPMDRAIEAINQAGSAVRIIAVDVPSGMDCDTGRPRGIAVRANETITFVARKAGFDAPGAASYTGRVHVVGIGCPPWLADSVRAVRH